MLSRFRRLRLTAWHAALALALLVTASPLGAECIAVDNNDLPRECTWLEELGACEMSVFASTDQCVDAANYMTTTIACWIGGAVDLAYCTFDSLMSIPFDFLGLSD